MSRLLAVGAGAATRAETLEDSQAGKDGPDEEAKGDGSLGDAAVAAGAAVRGDVDGDGNGASKPEEGGDAEQGEADEGVVQAGKDALGDADVEEDDNGPDDVEEHKVVSRVVEEVASDADDCGGGAKRSTRLAVLISCEWKILRNLSAASLPPRSHATAQDDVPCITSARQGANHSQQETETGGKGVYVRYAVKPSSMTRNTARSACAMRAIPMSMATVN